MITPPASKRLSQYRSCIGFLLLLMLIVTSSSYAQISPGDLAWAHEPIDGLTDCTKCHELGEGPSTAKCLNCHTAVKSRIDQRRGYHHTVVTVEKKACFSCHSEHAGREFKLIVWPDKQENFNHDLTGFHLDGKHANTICRDCHNPANIDRSLVTIEREIDLTKTFLGLGQNCINCHFDEHRGQLLNDCRRCHGGNSWKPAAAFNHDNAAFTLTGLHRSVECRKCHPVLTEEKPKHPQRNTYLKFIDLDFKNCSSCHKDRHDNKFGQNCANCHQTSGWNRVLTTHFDHSKTRFTLSGKHKSLKCKKCHTGDSKLAAMKFDECLSCHTDYHRGQFARRSDKGKCESCHTERGFSPSLFTIADHEQARFVLTGAHLAQPCFLCHKPVTDATGKEFTNFLIADRLCRDCHKDNHGGQFVNTKPIRQCADCHKQYAWIPASFDHNKDCSYPLQGAHKRASCDGCHKKVVETPQGLVIQYRSVDRKCESCHTSSANLTELNYSEG